MKKSVYIIVIVIICIPLFSIAGDPPPIGGDPTTDPGATPIGGSAPIGAGIGYILGLASLYGLYWIKKMNINLKSIT